MGRVCDLLIETNNDVGRAEELVYGHRVTKVDVPALLKQQEEARKETIEKLEKEVSTE
jgi:hypothetical protein